MTALHGDVATKMVPYLDAGITNRDSNWDDKFWNITNVAHKKNTGFIEAHTMKTNFATCTFMQAQAESAGKSIACSKSDQTATSFIHSRSVAEYLQGKYGDLKQEVFIVILRIKWF